VLHSCKMSSADLQTLVNLFATTYSANPNDRTAAELQIRRVTLCS